ncbi:hypothetical protein [Methanobrevibacter sp.]|uniref:hypothetical protein n=1 Tax=Methanobrevibacter sp. TaxID=66852 RepID=UPI0038635178
MLKNRKRFIGGNFLLCIVVICLIFTAVGYGVDNSFAVELNDTSAEIGLESNDMERLENSQYNEILEVDSQDSQDILGVIIEPKGNSFADIQEAINSAHDGDTVKLSGTYYTTGKGHMYIQNKKITLTSDTGAICDARNVERCLDINGGGSGTVISNIKFINGNYDVGSAIFVNTNNVRIENCIFEDNHAQVGGAIYTPYDLNIAAGTIIDNCKFRRNTAYNENFENYSFAAALSVYGKDSEITNCVFEDNWVKGKYDAYGGAIQLGLESPSSNIKVSGCTFRNNSAICINGASHGGAGCVRDGISYINCLFVGNVADQGGALTFHASGSIINCTFVNNTAEKLYGGALSTGFLYDYMKLDILDCNFDGNTAPVGGAVQAKGLNILIDNSNFKNNSVTRYGGAVNIEAEDVTIQNSVFNSNKANIDGGALYIKGKNTLVKDSSFISNEAIPDKDKLDDGLGGAIYINSSYATIQNNAFKFNTARNGSAIYYDESGKKLTLDNNEMFKNQAWVYHLPISAEDIYYGDSEKIKVILIGGNNIGDFDNLGVSNAIHNAADNFNIVIDGEYPIDGASDSGRLYQDDREYNINVLLTVKHEDGTVVYNETGYTNYLGEIQVDLDNLKAGKYYVSAKHYEDDYYKAITNATVFTVTPKVDNEVTKSVSKTIADFEDVVTWTITVKNHGPSDSTNVTVYDVLPEGLIWLNDTSNGKYDPNSGVLAIGDLKVNEIFSFDIVCVVNRTGHFINKVDVTAFEFDSNTTNNHDEKSIFVNPASDLAVVKSVSNTKPNYKDIIDWTIEITNNGPDTAHDVEMFDLIPKSLIILNADKDYDVKSGIWKVGTLNSGEKATLNIRCMVNGTGMIENFVRVNATEFDYDLTNNNDTERVFVDPASDLAIDKAVNASNVNFMDTVKWILTVSNNGPDAAENVRVLDLLPDGFTYIDSKSTKGKYEDGIFEIDKLSVGETAVIEIITLVETTGKHVNIANVSSDMYDFNLTNNEDNETILVNPSADLSVSKSVSDENPRFNDIVIWTIEIINNGPDDAHNVHVHDLLPRELVWIDDDSSGDYNPLTGILFIEELGVDESFILKIECRVNATGLIENRVLVNATEYDHNMTNNFDNETIYVEKSADVAIVKSVNNSAPNYNDLVKWTLVISNGGPDNATNVEVVDLLPEGLTLIDYTATRGFYDEGRWVMCCLNKGASETLEIICRVNKTGRIVNLASIRADEYDSNPDNNNDSESIDVPLAVDLGVIIKANNTSPLFGESVNWIIIVKNNGPDNATGVVLSDILPNELIFSKYDSDRGIYKDDVWDIGSLNVGDSVNLNITTVCDALGAIINDVDVRAMQYDWNMSNNHAQDMVDVRPVADLSVIKSVDKDSPNYGERVKWTLTVSNNGPNMATNVIVEDILPEGLTFLSSNGDYHGNIWQIGNLNVGEVKSLEIFCKVTSTGNFINVAKIRSDEYDPDESNNRAQKSISVKPASDLSVTKIASRYSYKVGDVIEYVIEVVNNGPDTAYNVKVSEILDEMLKLKSFKATKGGFNKASNVWTIATLRYGESAKLFIKVVAAGPGIIKNTVEVTSDTFDWDKSNNKDFAVVDVSKPSDTSKKTPKNDLNDEKVSNLETHPTANPIAVLMFSLLFSAIIFRKGYLKEKLN